MPTSSDWLPRSGATQMRRPDSAAVTDDRRVDSPPTAVSLSVLVPVYNERHLVEASLRGVLALQSPVIADLQVIAVDDGSTDGSGNVLDALQCEDPRLTVVHHERNRGKGAAIQTALALATGDVSLVHDADLEYNPATFRLFCDHL
jgi:glycosyltransferase involved in cell wall biosynthesis